MALRERVADGRLGGLVELFYVTMGALALHTPTKLTTPGHSGNLNASGCNERKTAQADQRKKRIAN